MHCIPKILHAIKKVGSGNYASEQTFWGTLAAGATSQRQLDRQKYPIVLAAGGGGEFVISWNPPAARQASRDTAIDRQSPLSESRKITSLEKWLQYFASRLCISKYTAEICVHLGRSFAAAAAGGKSVDV